MPEAVTARQMKRISSFARRKYAVNDFNHNVGHMELTVRWARYLAHKEKADRNVCVAAAYLHDIARTCSKGKKHGPGGARMARAFLESIGVPRDFIRAVCYAIAEHDSGSLKLSREAKILWDADKLQGIGPYGYVRIFGHHLHYDTRNIFRAHDLTLSRHRFFYKRFYTRTGRKLARILHESMIRFCGLLDAVRIPRPDEIR